MSRDWYPRSRDEQLHMVDTWLQGFQTKAPVWNIPPANVASLTAADTNAKTILAIVKSGERTAWLGVASNEAFKEMETEARFIKKHFLLIPPLTLADLPTLLLPLPDETHTPVPPPTGQPALTITYPGGPHVLMVHLAPLPGTEPPDSRGDYGYALYRGIMPQGGGDTGTGGKRQALSDEGAAFRLRSLRYAQTPHNQSVEFCMAKLRAVRLRRTALYPPEKGTGRF
ncbi:MAG: hypothetical protein LBF74_11290 [Treponema sp.]|nr:hypothetical protein [Treponema sp.]